MIFSTLQTQKFLEIFRYLPKGREFFDKRSLLLRLKDRLEYGKDLYEEFVAKLTLDDFRVIQKTKQEFIRVIFFFSGVNGVNREGSSSKEIMCRWR
jgi:hypothetical protein